MREGRSNDEDGGAQTQEQFADGSAAPVMGRSRRDRSAGPNGQIEAPAIAQAPRFGSIRIRLGHARRWVERPELNEMVGMRGRWRLCQKRNGAGNPPVTMRRARMLMLFLLLHVALALPRNSLLAALFYWRWQSGRTYGGGRGLNGLGRTLRAWWKGDAWQSELH